MNVDQPQFDGDVPEQQFGTNAGRTAPEALPESAPEEPVASFEDLAADGLVQTSPPGPGLPESIGWCFGIMFCQFVGGMIALIIALVVAMAAYEVPPQQFMTNVENLDGLPQLLLFGLPNAFVFALLIGLALLRLGKSPRRKLNLALPSKTQFLIVSSAVFPVGFVADRMWNEASRVWERILEEVPTLQFIEDSNIMEFLENLDGVPVLFLLFCLAVVPAVGEEFMLRGLVGRGLVARWGVVTGVLLTSILFAMLHMYPVHVVAVLPLGIMMHAIYLATRSLWAPILFHFFNNGLASLYTSAGLATEGEETPWWMAAIGLAYAVAAIALLYRYRTRYVDDEGQSFDPGYPSVEAPPEGSRFRRRAPESLLVGGLAGAIFLAEIGLIASDFVVPPPADAIEQVDEAP